MIFLFCFCKCYIQYGPSGYVKPISSIYKDLNCVSLFRTMNNTSLVLNNASYLLNNFPDEPTHQFTITEVLLHFQPASVYTDRIVSPIWYGIGLIGNPISAIVWLGRKSRKNSSAIYLGILAIVHTMNLITHFSLNELTYTWDIPTNKNHGLCEALNVLAIVPQYLAPLLVLGFTIERYIAVCHPFAKGTFCTVRRAIIVSASLTLLSCVIAAVQSCLWKYYPQYNTCLQNPQMENFQTIWTATTEILFFLVVPLCVLLFDVLVIREIKRITSQGPAITSTGGNQATTVTLLAVSFYFIFTLLPSSVVYAIQNEIPVGNVQNLISFESMASDSLWMKYFKYMAIRKVVEEICLSNSACYVFIYYATGQYFRKQVHSMFCRRLARSDPASEKTNYSLMSSNGNEMTSKL